MEGGCGVVDGEERQNRNVTLSLSKGVGFSVSSCDFQIGKKVTEGVASQRDDDLRLYESDLQLEPRHALFLLLIGRIPIVRRAIFDDIADVDFFALEAEGCEEFIEELSRGSDKRPSKFIFLLSRRFSDEHNRCMGISFA